MKACRASRISPTCFSRWGVGITLRNHFRLLGACRVNNVCFHIGMEKAVYRSLMGGKYCLNIVR